MKSTLCRCLATAFGVAIGTVAALHALGVPAAAQNVPLVEVTEAAWTSSVADLQFTNRYDNGSRVPHAPLFLWTRMRATPRALEKLRAEGKLPIKHQWTRYVGAEIVLDEQRPIDAISLGVGRADLLNRLDGEVRQRGYFDWRTWSMKENAASGGWQVEVVYNDGAPVFCTDGGKQAPCRYFIWIR